LDSHKEHSQQQQLLSSVQLQDLIQLKMYSNHHQNLLWEVKQLRQHQLDYLDRHRQLNQI